MLERIDALLRKIEEAREEIEILLGLCKFDFLTYIRIKRGEMAPPEGVGQWTLDQLDQEVQTLKETIAHLEKIRQEVLEW